MTDGHFGKRIKPKPVHPWSPGSVSPIPYKAGPHTEDHEKYDKPIPIQELAQTHGVRWYRDTCGDDYIPGLYGEIFRYGIGKLGVQLGGPRANNTKAKGAGKRIRAIIKQYHWTISQEGDGEIVFIVDESDIGEALKAIKSYRMPKGGSLPNTPESRQRGAMALQKWREESGI